MRGREGNPARRGHHTEPDPSSEHAVNEDVIRRLKKKKDVRLLLYNVLKK